MIKSAVISGCGTYRYSLSRVWDEELPMVMFIMLNPSTADAKKDDPTIRRCINFAKSWGYGGICVGNLFAYRSAKPKSLFETNYPFGIENDFHLKLMADICEIAVCAWGNSKIVNKLYKDSKSLSKIGINLHYIDLSIDGTPKHPLYLKGNLKPKKYAL